MSKQVMPPCYHYLEETDSTNSYLRRLLEEEELPEGTAVVAGFQKAGRGQVGNSWESEAGKNLLFSMVLYPDSLLAAEQFLLSQIVCLSLKQVLDNYTEGISVKWPNDVYWQDRKIAGILIENDLSGAYLSHSIVGIGLNLNQERFTSPAPNPVSLKQITGETYDIESILGLYASSFFSNYIRLFKGETEDIRAEYGRALYRRNGYFTYEDADGIFEARIHAVEADGRLVLALPDGTLRRYAFKEVVYLKRSLGA